MIYLTGVHTEATEAAAATEPMLGLLAQPGNALHKRGHAFAGLGLDNGGFGLALRGEEWTEELIASYLTYLERVVADAPEADLLFATAPDVLRLVEGIGVVGDHAATVERSRTILPRIRAIGIPAAFVAQDGMELDEAFDWDSIDVLFIGGSDGWKLGAGARTVVAEAKARGKRVHMGRVNSYKRLAYAASIGCDTADGTFLLYGKKDENLPKLLGWLKALRNAEAQLDIFAA